MFAPRRLVPWLTLCLVFVAAGNAVYAGKALSENDLKRLVEMQISDDAVVAKIQKDGLAFALDQEARARLREAGASEKVLAAAEKTGPAGAPAEQPAAPIMVWVERSYHSTENPLHSEFSINGKTVDIFTSDTRKEIGNHLKKGWNTIAIKTTPQEPASGQNELIFRIGPVHKDPKTDRMVMRPVLWEFRNGSDWRFREGRFTHRLGPGVKDVTLDYRVYYAGLDLEDVPMENGDYVVEGEPSYSSTNVPLTATVYVNGTPLSTFLGEKRQVVITPLLKQGKNEIKIVTNRVKDAISDNDIAVEVFGPVHYNPRTEKFEAKPMVQLKAMQGWERDRTSGQLVSKADREAKSMERASPFFLDEAPVVARRHRTEAGRR